MQVFVCAILGHKGMLTIHTILLTEKIGQMKGSSVHQIVQIIKCAVKL